MSLTEPEARAAALAHLASSPRHAPHVDSTWLNAAAERADLWLFQPDADLFRCTGDFLIGSSEALAVHKASGAVHRIPLCCDDELRVVVREHERAHGLTSTPVDEAEARGAVAAQGRVGRVLALPGAYALVVERLRTERWFLVERTDGRVHEVPRRRLPFGLAVAAFVERDARALGWRGPLLGPPVQPRRVTPALARRCAERLLRRLDPEGRDGLVLSSWEEARHGLILFPLESEGARVGALAWPHRVAVVRATGEAFVVPEQLDRDREVRDAALRRGLAVDPLDRDEATEAVRRWLGETVLRVRSGRAGVRVALRGPVERPAVWGVRVRLDLPGVGPAAPIDLAVHRHTGRVTPLEQDGLPLSDALYWHALEHALPPGRPPLGGPPPTDHARGFERALQLLGAPARRIEDRPGLWVVHGLGRFALDKATGARKALCARPFLEGAARDLEEERGHLSPAMGQDEAAGLAREALRSAGHDALLLEAEDRGRVWVIHLAGFGPADGAAPRRWRRLPPLAVRKETCGVYSLAEAGVGRGV